jgi:hypothetical protein
MPVSFKDVLDAFEFVSGGAMGEHQAFLCKASGKIHYKSDFFDELDELGDEIDDNEKNDSEDIDALTDNIEDDEKFIQIPDKRELDLGKPLALDFAGEFLPNDYDDVRRMFSRRGAYANFKALLARRNELDRWYDFEAKATETALRAWCKINEIEVGE